MTLDDTVRARHKPNIYDVAARAGVSHMTVSRVLNDHPNITESTRTRVIAAIGEMNYKRSSIARALATNRAMRVGVLVDRPIEYGPNCTLRALEAAARLEGYAVSAFAVEDDEDLRIAEGVDNLLTQGVDALCVIAPRAASLEALREILPPLPTVVIQASPDPSMLTAAVDQHAGATLAVQHLLALGHRRILHIAGPPDWLDARARADAWRQAMSAAGLAECPMIVGDWTSDFGYHVGAEHAAIDDVTAVFAGNDEMALGLIHGLSVRGLRVPDDISIVGFDDAPDTRHFLPPLTTVRQDFHELGTAAMRLLMEAIADPGAPAETELIMPSLVIRSSTAPASPGHKGAPAAADRP